MEDKVETHRSLLEKVNIEGAIETHRRDYRDLWKVTVEETVETHRRDHGKDCRR